ncbi:precorrin-2 dehydrogenase/sirohydrochlorin ferrochelatase family protein [Thermodesulfovibrio hydrogeniphilus]
MPKWFPILINIEGKKCVVVGGGSVAERKIKKLLEYGGCVTVISPEITLNIKKLFEKGKIDYLNKEYSPEDIKDAYLVVAATSDKDLNAQILKDATFLVNCVNMNASSDVNAIEYIVPAIFEKENLTISVSTEFPALSKVIRDELKEFYGKEFALYLKYLKKIRREIKAKIKEDKQRQEIFREIASKEIVAFLRQHGFKKTKEKIEEIIMNYLN